MQEPNEYNKIFKIMLMNEFTKKRIIGEIKCSLNKKQIFIKYFKLVGLPAKLIEKKWLADEKTWK